MKTVQLRNDVLLPMIGAGMWKITDREQMRDVIRTAYQCGYRLFDSAAVYYNEMVLGKALAELQLPRDEIILQDKLWNTCYGYENAQTACKHSLKKLKMDYLAFVAVALVCYYMIPRKWQWTGLLFFSIFFYCLVAVPYTFVYILISTATAWIVTNGLARYREKK